MAVNETVDGGAAGKPYKSTGLDDAGKVAQPTSFYAALRPDLALIHTLLAGTSAMVAAGRDYLPQHQYEEDKAYQGRLEGTVLLPATEQCLDDLVGRAFEEAPQPDEDVPEPILDLMEDVDAAGTGWVPFARHWFRSGVRDQVAYCLVDHTAAPAREDGEAPTKADDAAAGVRPFWRLIQACDMLELRRVQAGGKTVVTMARFRDDTLEPVEPWGERLVERVKIVRPGSWETWVKEQGKGAGGKDKWVYEDGGVYDAPEVRIVELKVGDKPTLLGLAHLNKRHWVSTSDQNNILTVTRFPILAASGVKSGDADGLVIGPKKMLTTSAPEGKVYYVEHAGAAVEAGEKDLSHLEEMMSTYGTQFTSKSATGPKSATEAQQDDDEAVSPLRSWVHDFRDCLELALKFTADWLGLGDDAGGSVLFDMEDSEAGLKDQNELTFIKGMRDKGDLTRKSILEEAKRRRILPEDFDVDAELEAADAEADANQERAMASGGLTGMFPKPAAAKPPAKPPA